MQSDRIGGSDRPREGGYFRLPGGESGGLLSEWRDRKFGEFLRASAGFLAGKAGGSSTKAVFLCGSFSGGDGSLFEDGGRIVILSDIDLVIVVDSRRVHDRLLEMRADLGGECERLAAGVDFIGRVEVGVLVPRSLFGLAKSPGVYGMISHPVIIWGDRDITRLIPPFRPSEIPREEGLRLLENRIAPHLGFYHRLETADDKVVPAFHYQTARIYTDIVTAVLCATGRYEAGYESRMTILEESMDDPLISWLAGGKETVSKAKTWTAFKLRPDPRRFIDSAGAPENLWLNGGTDLLSTWRRCEAFLRGFGTGEGEIPKASQLMDTRKKKKTSMDNVRRWKKYLLSRDSRSRVRILSGRMAEMASTEPLDAVRREGIRLLERMIEEGPRALVKAPKGGFPHGGGSACDAARSVSLAWNELVSGRGG